MATDSADSEELATITVDGHTLSTGVTEFRVLKSFKGFDAGIYLRVKALTQTDGGYNVTFSHANGIGPDEIEIPLETVLEAIGSKLQFDTYDPQMHD